MKYKFINWYHLLLIFYWAALSCTGNVKEPPVYSFVTYTNEAAGGMVYSFRDCVGTQEQKGDYKIWKYADCFIPALWHISTQPGDKSLFYTTSGDSAVLLLVDSFICFSPVVPPTKTNKIFVFTEHKESKDGNHYYYYHDKYGIFLVESTARYSGIKLLKIDQQYRDSLELVQLAARIGMERSKDRQLSQVLTSGMNGITFSEDTPL